MDTEKKLREIIQSGKPKLFKINGEKKYISKKIINDIKINRQNLQILMKVDSFH